MNDYPNRPMFAVDWDNTCVAEYDDQGKAYWPEMGPWLPGAIEALRELSSIGKTVIYSLRCHLYELDDTTPRPRGEAGLSMSAIQSMLTDAGLSQIDVYPPNRGKPPALCYVDDRAVEFVGDWPFTLRRLKRLAEAAGNLPVTKYEYRFDFTPGQASHRRPLGSKGKWEPLMDKAKQEDAMGSGQDFGLRTRQVVEQASGVMRDTDEGKLQPILCFDGPMFERWAAHLTKGISARGKRNWMLACTEEDLERFKESFVRHATQYLRGDTDEDHVAAMFFNLNGAEYVRERLAQDSPPELHAA